MGTEAVELRDVQYDTLYERSLDTSNSETELMPQMKRHRYQMLTYLAANYLRVIYTLLVIIVVLLTTLIIALIYIVNFTSITYQDFGANSTVSRNSSRDSFGEQANLTREIDFGRIGNQPPHSSNITTPASVSSEGSNNFERTIPCRKVNCSRYEQPCNVTDVDYRSIKIYGCCHCIQVNGTELQLIRYQSHSISRTVSLVLSGENKYCDHPWTLRNLPDLSCLSGSWDTYTDAPGSCMLMYSIASTTCDFKPDD